MHMAILLEQVFVGYTMEMTSLMTVTARILWRYWQAMEV